jgi:hypothetical protein
VLVAGLAHYTPVASILTFGMSAAWSVSIDYVLERREDELHDFDED